MDEKKSKSTGVLTFFLIITLLVIIGMAYYIYIENKQISILESDTTTMKNTLIDLQQKIDTQLASNVSTNTITDLTLGTYQITNYVQDDGPYYGDVGVTITDNNLCSVYIGEGCSYLGTYTIKDNKIICNTLIERGEEGGRSYSEKNIVFEYEIIESDEIKLVNITPSKLFDNDPVLKYGTTYKLSTNSNFKVLLDNN